MSLLGLFQVLFPLPKPLAISRLAPILSSSPNLWTSVLQKPALMSPHPTPDAEMHTHAWSQGSEHPVFAQDDCRVCHCHLSSPPGTEARQDKDLVLMVTAMPSIERAHGRCTGNLLKEPSAHTIPAAQLPLPHVCVREVGCGDL